MKKILFLSVGRRVELLQSFREAAFVLGKEILIYGENISDSAPGLFFCDRRIILPPIKDENYVSELIKKASEDRIDLIIPTIDTNLLILAQNKKRFEEQEIKVLISSAEMVGICRDKNMTSEFFVKCGLKAPMPVNDWKEYNGGFPAFIKPKDGSSSVDAYKVENGQELETYANQVSDYIVQPYITGTEYTVDIFADFEGKPIYIMPRVRLAVRAGEVLKTQIDLDGQIIEESKKICENFKPCGPITVQLIRDKDGIDQFIEINPRFGGGVPLSMKAGAKSAEAILQLLDKEDVVVHKVENGNAYSRFDESVCMRRKQSINPKGVIFDLDDTLYSEKEYVRSGFRAVAEHLGDEKLSDRLWACLKAGKPAFDEVLCELRKENEIEECIRIYRDHEPKIHLYEGVRDLIKDFDNRGIKVGIITDGRPNGQRNKIKALGLDELIGEENIIITDELGGIPFRKPCDIAFRIMARRWKMNFEDVIYVGDNVGKDFQAPQQLGMQSVWFWNGDGLYQKDKGDRVTIIKVISDLRELLIL